ncbi:hypothetical protein H4R24_005589 [Coemansia sp. RSA 988]|nr:hypothetical protein H4R24_005589 [Coemansia sp. RSA 988]
MGFLVGLGAALAGNVVIGAGQCLQKYALTGLEREWEAQRAQHLEGGSGYSESIAYAAYPNLRSRGNSVGSRDDSSKDVAQRGSRPRYTSWQWVMGLAMNYAGEMFGNSVALSYLSAAAVAPLGIVSVAVNLVLAERFLGERITPNQRFGLTVIAAGVLCILAVAPRRAAASDASQFVEVVARSGILRLLGVTAAAQAVVIGVLRSGRQTLFLYVLASSLFGAMNVMAAKLLTTYVRLRMAFPTLLNPADVAVYGAVGAAQARPLVASVTVPQAVAAIVAVGSVVGQEAFRQQALGRFSPTQFQPVFFATYNVVATLASLVLFRELDGWTHALIFFSAFLVGIALIVYGARFLQKAPAVVLPSHIKLRKENLGLKTQ